MTATAHDLIVRGGTVVDGTGFPAYTADVAVRDGRIAAVGRVDGNANAAEAIDADGLVVTPGFIDIHTHYDAQLHWEPSASPSSWHGVTTVIAGNCGFSLAPARPDDVPWLLNMLSRVEGMSPATLAAGVTFEGGSLADFAAGLAPRLGVNIGLQVGHSAVRRYAMGEDASKRAATEDEIAQMQELVRAACRDGAVGFTSSQLEIHMDHDGQPVPSNLSEPAELIALASVLAETPGGAIEFISGTNLEGHSEADRELMLAMCRASGKPMNVNPLARLPHVPDGWRRSLEFADQARAQGCRVYPQSMLQQMGVFFALGDTFLFDEMPTFRDTLTLAEPERAQRLRDPLVREAMRREMADPTGRSFVFGWDAVKVARADRHPEWVGRTVPELAAEFGGDPLDCFLECSLAENLATVFTLSGSPGRKSHDATAEALRHPMVLPGSSDAGAHLASYCGVDFTTRLLSEWAPDAISLEDAVARLTRMSASVYGFSDRGFIAPGAWADLTIYDPTRLGVGATRWVEDFPAGGGRFVVDAEGYVATVVNGQVAVRNGEPTGAHSGRVLRVGS
jgi:N-acyl-D-aspartate/D-glutamate deacylase